MKKVNYCDIKTEELIKKKTAIKFVTGMLIGALIALLAITIYNNINESKFSALTVIPLALSPIVFVNWSQVKLINKELESRGVSKP